jgi:hypothetical protein
MLLGLTSQFPPSRSSFTRVYTSVNTMMLSAIGQPIPDTAHVRTLPFWSLLQLATYLFHLPILPSTSIYFSPIHPSVFMIHPSL